jgi:hypothetical protein
MKLPKDIQIELYALTKDMTHDNIYSQLSYFLVEVALKDPDRVECAAFAAIVGLLADSYYGQKVIFIEEK